MKLAKNAAFQLTQIKSSTLLPMVARMFVAMVLIYFNMYVHVQYKYRDVYWLHPCIYIYIYMYTHTHCTLFPHTLSIPVLSYVLF